MFSLIMRLQTEIKCITNVTYTILTKLMVISKHIFSGIKCFAASQQNLKFFTASFFLYYNLYKNFQNTITASLIWLTASQRRCRRCSVYAALI